MITFKRLDKERRDYLKSVLAEESKDAREAIDRDMNLFRHEILKVAAFLELLYDGEIIIWDKTLHTIYNKDGTINVAVIYPVEEADVSIWCAWNPLTQRLRFEMSPEGRKLLARKFNYKG